MSPEGAPTGSTSDGMISIERVGEIAREVVNLQFIGGAALETGVGSYDPDELAVAIHILEAFLSINQSIIKSPEASPPVYPTPEASDPDYRRLVTDLGQIATSGLPTAAEIIAAGPTRRDPNWRDEYTQGKDASGSGSPAQEPEES